MSNENITAQPQTATSPSDAGGANPGTLKNGWSATPGGVASTQASPDQPANQQGSPVQPAPAMSQQPPTAQSQQAAPSQSQQRTPPVESEQVDPGQPASDRADSVKADAAGETKPAESPVAATPPTENREQLHRRVQSRIAELEEARAQLEGQDGNKQRARAIENELQLARDAMSGGWEHVGAIEAAHLSQWLTNTGTLIVAKNDPETTGSTSTQTSEPAEAAPSDPAVKLTESSGGPLEPPVAPVPGSGAPASAVPTGPAPA